MRRISRRRRAGLALPLAGLLCACAGAGAGTPLQGGTGERLAVRRSAFRPRHLLSGELVARRAEPLVVPRTPSFQVQIRWLEKDGTRVAAGQPVVAFDNSSFTGDLEEKRLQAAEAESELRSATAQAEAAGAEKAFQVEQKRAEAEKARGRAAVPADLLPLREQQERRLALERAEAELGKAEEDLRAHQAATRADLEVRRLEIARSRREIRTAEEALGSLTLVAPAAGILLVGQHPWEGRKLREGDSVWVGMAVASLPDLASLGVDAQLVDVDDGRIAPGMAAVSTLDAYPGLAFPGRIAEISPLATESARNPLLRSFAVRVDLARLDPARMRPGMSVKVEVLGPPRRGVLLAPRAGLDFAAGPAAAAPGRARALLAAGGERTVDLGPCGPLECVVLSGLAEGERLRPRDGEEGG